MHLSCLLLLLYELDVYGLSYLVVTDFGASAAKISFLSSNNTMEFIVIGHKSVKSNQSNHHKFAQ
jgi:hypothetical protein